MNADEINAELAETVSDAIKLAIKKIEKLGFCVGQAVERKSLEEPISATGIFVVTGVGFKHVWGRSRIELIGRAFDIESHVPVQYLTLGDPSNYKVLTPKAIKKLNNRGRK